MKSNPILNQHVYVFFLTRSCNQPAIISVFVFVFIETIQSLLINIIQYILLIHSFLHLIFFSTTFLSFAQRAISSNNSDNYVSISVNLPLALFDETGANVYRIPIMGFIFLLPNRCLTKLEQICIEFLFSYECQGS